MHSLLKLLPDRVRLPVLTALYATIGGLVTVAFMFCVNRSYGMIWHRLAALSNLQFALCSLAVVTVTSAASGRLMSKIYPAAAGSGIPQLKAAYWTDLGFVSLAAPIVKFLSGTLALAGGASLGREGPTVFIAGGLASNVAGGLGVGRHRRHAVSCGAAAGLAAAFNTPLAAVSFVLEELLGDLNSRFLGSVTLAAVCGAFIVYAFVGKQPSFAMPSVDAPSWNLYVAVPLAALLASGASVAFQRGCLGLRKKMRSVAVADWLKPTLGGLVTWALGCAVFVTCRRLGVFGLGYDDLSDALSNGIGWKIAGVLALAKLGATIASYGTGGCGGIFSPTLFIGAMCGFFTAGLLEPWLHLTTADQLILAATGMSACFGGTVRAPFSAILMIFEMTHQFGMVPALLLGTLISQTLVRFWGKHNFYDAVLLQDGHSIHKIAPPRDLSGWRHLPVAVLANRAPVALTSLEPPAMRDLLNRHPYRCFPVILSGEVRGVTTRGDIQHALSGGGELSMERAVICQADQSLQEVEPRMLESRTGFFLVQESPGAGVIGVFTLHDLLRAQAALLE